MTIEYAQLHPELRRVVGEATELCTRVHPNPSPEWNVALAEATARLEVEERLRVVLVGEWNAGKSSLIKALTGIEDIVIDADVCTTEITEYPWHGVVLVDTPGVQAEATATDHDAISRRATVGADLVLFVITNELFNPRLGQHLRFVVGSAGLGLASKTAVVINKMDREQNSDEVIVSEVVKVLGPDRDVPVWLCATGKFFEAMKAPSERAEKTRRQSRLHDLVNQIDTFVRDAGTTGRLATPLQVVGDVLERAQLELVETQDAKKQLELIRRQRRVVNELAVRLVEIRKSAKQTVYSAVMAQAESAVGQITDEASGEDLASLFESGLSAAAADVEAARDQLSSEMMGAYAEAQQKAAELGRSPLAEEVTGIQADKAARAAVDDVKPGGRGAPNHAKFAKGLMPQMQNALKAVAADRSVLREAYYKVGKALGHKFRPWEALKGAGKLAKLAGGIAKAVPFLAFAADAYINYREEKVVEEKARHLANMRISLRKAFIDQAKIEAETVEQSSAELVAGPVQSALAALAEEAEQVTQGATKRNDLATRLAALRADCVNLRARIHREMPTAPDSRPSAGR